MALPAIIATDPQQRLQLPDLRRPERMPSLPAWVALRIASLTIEQQRDLVTGQWRTVPTLPAGMMMATAEREEIEKHVADLEALCHQTAESDPQVEQDMVTTVTAMMLALSSPAQNVLSAEVRGAAFMEALDDVAVWAVKAAIRRWHRGDCGTNSVGKPYDYHWCPAPAELRRIALFEMYRIKERADSLKRLLQAEERIEYSDEHCSVMRERFGDLLRQLRNTAGRE